MNIRQATSSDIPAVYDIWYRNQFTYEEPPVAKGNTSYFGFVQRCGHMLVATESDLVIGFAASLSDDKVTYLSDLFVDPDVQGRGIGRSLLSALFPNAIEVFTFSSADPRAVHLYKSFGIKPHWIDYWLRADEWSDIPEPTRELALDAVPPDNQKMIALDAACCSRRRPNDFAYWAESEGADQFLISHEREVIGYGIVRRKAFQSLWRPDAITFGPIGVIDETFARDAVLRIIHEFAPIATCMRIVVPEEHPALPELLDCGFIKRDEDTYCAVVPRIDPTRYVYGEPG